MNEAIKNYPPISDRSGVTDAVRTQILATEHWSLLATRSMTWNEMFTRTSMFITLLSAAVVALALVGQASDFGEIFRVIALLVLPLVLIMGFATFIRLGHASNEDVTTVVGMNRLRHAYLELAPELEPYFTTAHTDDDEGITQTLGWPDSRVTFARMISSTHVVAAAINIVVSGVFVALVAGTLGAPDSSLVLIGVVAGVITGIVQFALAFRFVRATDAMYKPRFTK